MESPSEVKVLEMRILFGSASKYRKLSNCSLSSPERGKLSVTRCPWCLVILTCHGIINYVAQANPQKTSVPWMWLISGLVILLICAGFAMKAIEGAFTFYVTGDEFVEHREN